MSLIDFVLAVCGVVGLGRLLWVQAQHDQILRGNGSKSLSQKIESTDRRVKEVRDDNTRILAVFDSDDHDHNDERLGKAVRAAVMVEATRERSKTA